MDTIGDMQVVTQCGTSWVATATPGSCTVRYANARPVQITSTDSAAPSDFVAMGYAAGCVSGKQNTGTACSGVASSGKVNKKFYVDGQYCNPTCFYFQTWYDAISGGALHRYQIQRKSVSGVYKYLMYFNGGGTRTVTINNVSMRYGQASWGSENAAPEGGAYSQTVNLDQPQISDIWTHLYGTASASSPGTTNYARLTSAPTTQQPHAGCSIAWSSSSWSLRVTGRC